MQAVHRIDQEALRDQISELYYSPDIREEQAIYTKICADWGDGFKYQAQTRRLLEKGKTNFD